MPQKLNNLTENNQITLSASITGLNG